MPTRSTVPSRHSRDRIMAAWSWHRAGWRMFITIWSLAFTASSDCRSLPQRRVPYCRRLDFMRGWFDRSAPARGGLCRPHSQGREAGRRSCAGTYKTRVVINLKTAKALGLAVPPRSLSPPTRSRIYFRLRTDLIVHDFAISRARPSVANYLVSCLRNI